MKDLWLTSYMYLPDMLRQKRGYPTTEPTKSRTPIQAHDNVTSMRYTKQRQRPISVQNKTAIVISDDEEPSKEAINETMRKRVSTRNTSKMVRNKSSGRFEKNLTKASQN